MRTRQEGGRAGGQKTQGHLERLLHPRLRGVLSMPGLEGQLGSAVSVLRPWARRWGKATGLGRGRPAAREDQLVSSAPGSPGDPRADLPMTWRLRGGFHPQTGMEGSGFLGGAGSGREGGTGGGGGGGCSGPEAFPERQELGEGARGRGGRQGEGRGRGPWLADKVCDLSGLPNLDSPTRQAPCQELPKRKHLAWAPSQRPALLLKSTAPARLCAPRPAPGLC